MLRSSNIEWIANPSARHNNSERFSTDFLSRQIIETTKSFHKSFPEYCITPIHSLDRLAEMLDLDKLWVKDESYRFDLNAFKVLGGSYAIGKYLSEKLGVSIEELSFEKLVSVEVKEKLGEITFVTATDGNHGRGVAWAARQLGHKAIVFMPKGSSETRLSNIKAEGAEAYITDLNYDDAVRFASEYARKHNGVILQDTAWEGYEDIPIWIMQGYTTLIDETLEQLSNRGEGKPTHVFLQAGVGAFAGAIQGYLAERYGDERPITIVVEPDEAACIYKSAKAGDGKPHPVTGYMPTIMAGLACGEPNIIGWNILRDYSDIYLSCKDYVTEIGMRILGNPIKGDPQVISGESGAIGLGAISLILKDNSLKDLAKKLSLCRDSKVLIISTEGDTDPKNYRKIVWGMEF